MDSHSNITTSTDLYVNVTPDATHIRVAATIHVVSVGPVARGLWIHDALLHEPNSRLTIATDYRQLWGIPPRESIQAAILHDTLSSFELDAACRLIRQRWPQAKILVVSREESFLEDALYDDRIVPAMAPRVLMGAIERVAHGSPQNRNLAVPSSCLTSNTCQT
jgi:hypothetical protein